MDEKLDEINTRKVGAFEVFVNTKNNVVIAQAGSFVWIHPSQAKLLFKWITECATEAREDRG
jgi:hypothetical protein